MEGRVDDEAIGDAMTKSVELEESAAVEMEAIATDEASMETSSAEAPTTMDSFTQTEPVKVPRLVSRRMKIKSEDLIALDKLAFPFKKNMQIREGQDAHGPNGSATRARQRCVKQLIERVARNDLIPEQLVFVLRDASVHEDARLHFKSAGLIDPDEFETLKLMMSQADKFLEKVFKTESTKGRVANERREMVNSFFSLVGADDATAASNVTVPSKRRRLDLLKSIPKSTGNRIMRKMEAKRSVLMLGSPSKSEWQTITSRKGKGLKVSDEDRAKIVQWVKDHPDVVASPIRRDTVWCKAPTPEDPDRKVKRNKLLRTISVRELHNDLHKPGFGLPEIVMKNGVIQLCDTVLREITPPEVRKMSKFLKEMRCCRICESMSFKQDALNMWRRKKRKELKAKWEELPEGTTRGQRDAKETAAEELALFVAEGFAGDEDLDFGDKDLDFVQNEMRIFFRVISLVERNCELEGSCVEWLREVQIESQRTNRECA